MKLATIPRLIVVLSLLVSSASAQKTEITISFSEQFFDALLDAVFRYAAPPEFSLAQNLHRRDAAPQRRNLQTAFSFSPTPRAGAESAPCYETVKLMRESGGRRTSVRFRDGRITAPIAFSGNYNPPLIGCVPFAGVAETTVELEFDGANQRLIARARVNDVSLNGTGGIGGALVARMVQGSIDRKINPIEIIRTDKVSFILPLQNSNGVRMRATGFTHDISNGQLNVRVAYEFEKIR